MNRIEELRVKRNIGRRELSEAIGVSVTTVCLWENETRNISLRHLAQVAEYFGVSAAYLRGVDDCENQEEADPERVSWAIRGFVSVERRGEYIPISELHKRVTLGDRLRTARIYAGYNQGELAERLEETKKRTISLWETDKCAPNMKTIANIAAVCGVDIAELMSGTKIFNRLASPDAARTPRPKFSAKLVAADDNKPAYNIGRVAAMLEIETANSQSPLKLADAYTQPDRIVSALSYVALQCSRVTLVRIAEILDLVEGERESMLSNKTFTQEDAVQFIFGYYHELAEASGKVAGQSKQSAHEIQQ